MLVRNSLTKKKCPFHRIITVGAEKRAKMKKRNRIHLQLNTRRNLDRTKTCTTHINYSEVHAQAIQLPDIVKIFLPGTNKSKLEFVIYIQMRRVPNGVDWVFNSGCLGSGTFSVVAQTNNRLPIPPDLIILEYECIRDLIRL